MAKHRILEVGVSNNGRHAVVSSECDENIVQRYTLEKKKGQIGVRFETANQLLAIICR